MGHWQGMCITMGEVDAMKEEQVGGVYRKAATVGRAREEDTLYTV